MKRVALAMTADAELKGPLLIDLTYSAHTAGRTATGIGRVEQALYYALDRDPEAGPVVPVAWSRTAGSFFRLDPARVRDGTFADDLQTRDRRDPDALGRWLARNGPARSGSAQTGWQTGAQLIGFSPVWARHPGYAKAVAALRRESGTGFVILIHDLIRIVRADLYPPGSGVDFAAAVQRIAALADGLLVYSSATAHDVATLLPGRKLARIRLGEAWETSPDPLCTKPPDPVVARHLDRAPVLFVSSIDPRKNHALAIRVWRDLIAQRGPGDVPELVFVGKSFWPDGPGPGGWASGDPVAADRLADPALAGRVHHLEAVSDTDLDRLYRACRFTLYPSLAEGWGLPVAESLGHGKPCLASATTATAEIAPDLTDLLDPSDTGAWVAAVGRYLDDPAALAARSDQIVAGFEPCSWSQSARTVRAALAAVPQPERPRGRVAARIAGLLRRS
jgi:glycosyltransferase involved in cell wall biosynthesis